jgi:hypothetical protein
MLVWRIEYISPQTTTGVVVSAAVAEKINKERLHKIMQAPI